MSASIPSRMKPAVISYRAPAKLRFDSLPSLHLAPVATERSSEDEWLRDFYATCLHVRDYLELSARVKQNRRLSAKKQEILIGHMVRLYKLYDTFLLLISEGRTEIAWMLMRPIFETGINLEFLIKRGDEKVFESYQRASLAHDKKTLERSSSYRTSYLPDDKALKAEILAGFERSGFAFDEVDQAEERWGGEGYRTLFEKAKAVESEFEYDFGFRYSSQMLHGTWFDLEQFHLVSGVGEYRPKIGYRRPTSDLLPGASAFCMTVAAEYAVFMSSVRKNPLVLVFATLGDWFHTMLEAHQRFVLQAEKKRVN